MKARAKAQAQAVPRLNTERGRQTYSQAQVNALAEELTDPKPSEIPNPPPSILTRIKKIFTYPFRRQTQAATFTENELSALSAGDPNPSQPQAAQPTAPDAIPAPGKIFWGMRNLTESIAKKHLLVVGSTGSGKTTILRLLMQSVLPNIRAGSEQRAFIYDAKRDMLPILKGMDLGCPIHILNPFDQNSTAWDLAADITTPAAALQLATTLLPAEEQATQRYFTDAARHLLYGVLRSFIARTPGAWTLRDVLLAMRSQKALLAVLREPAESKEIGDIYIKNEQTFDNVFSTIATKMLPFEIVAALWSKAKERKSLSDWLNIENGESILLFAHHPSYTSAITPINHAIFKHLSDLLLSGPETDTKKTWLFLDEVREAGRLEGLRSLLNQGRSKGARVVLGFQDIEGMRKQYGHEEAHEIVGLCNSRTFLRTDSFATAKWAQENVGESQVYEQKVSRCETETTGTGPGGSTSSTSIATTYSTEHPLRHVLMASELMNFPDTGPDNGLHAYHVIPSLCSYETSTPWADIKLFPKKEHVKGEETRPPEEQFLVAWSPEEIKEKCPPSTQPATSPEESAKSPPNTPSASDALKSVSRWP